VNLAPDSLEDRLALAQCGLLFKNLTLVTNTLAQVSPAGKQTAEYQHLAGIAAIAMNQIGEATTHFIEASRLAPNDPKPQLSLALMRMQSTNAQDTAEARMSLKRVSQTATNDIVRVQALRELVADAMRSKDVNSALALSTELIRYTNAAFGDKLQRLDILRGHQPTEYTTLLSQYQREAATNSAALSDMTIWLTARVSTASALNWLQGLPAATRTNQPAAVLVAECIANMKNWPALQRTLEKQNWQEVEFMRHAFLARALREQNLAAASAAEWEVAVKFAGGQKVTLVSLFRIAAAWSWINEAEQILWTVVNRYPEEKWAGQVLQQALMSGGRTRPLMQLISLQAKRAPDNLSIKNNLAFTAMLLDAKEISPHAMSREVYQQMPNNPSYVSTYAFSLYLQKQYREARATLEQLRPEQLNDPSVAGYYGLALRATGDVARATPYLNWALNKALLLPEERRLFEQALKN
jgi:cytochrome c-type biogenesis protein CcmH/NrfG